MVATSPRPRTPERIPILFPRWEDIPDEGKYAQADVKNVLKFIASYRTDGTMPEFDEDDVHTFGTVTPSESLAMKLILGFARVVEE